MTVFLDGYCLNTEEVKETKGVCFDNLTFSSGPEVSSLSPWALGVVEGGTEQEGPGGLHVKKRVLGLSNPWVAIFFSFGCTGPGTECHLGCQSGLVLLSSL